MTSKPISCITYNTIPYLQYKLNELLEQHTICDYFFIKHYPESDEGGKEHIHLWIEPNKRLDPMDIQKFLEEFDPEHPDLPLKPTKFVPSDVDNALLYFLHDPRYLAMKGQSREFHYEKDDFYFPDLNTFEQIYRHAFQGSNFALRNSQLDGIINNSNSLHSLIDCGLVPLSMAGNLNAYSNLKTNDEIAQKKERLNRNGRNGHE